MQSSRSRSTGIVLAIAVIALALVAGFLLRPAPTTGYPAGAIAQEPVASPQAQRGAQPTPPVSAAAALSESRLRSAVASTPLPPPGTPLLQSYDELKRQADAGVSAAASRLFREVRGCLTTRRAQERIADMLPSALAVDPKRMTSAQAKGYETFLSVVKSMMAGIERNRERCAGVTQAQLDAIVPVTLRAAQLGDTKAIDCYVSNAFQLMPALLDHPQWLADYRSNAPALLDHAVRNGDWIAVDLVNQAYAGMLDDFPAGQLFAPDPAMGYRYLRLERLGATGAFAEELDGQLDAIARDLSPRQRAAADEWAGDAYSRYFHDSSSNELRADANACQGGSD